MQQVSVQYVQLGKALEQACLHATKAFAAAWTQTQPNVWGGELATGRHWSSRLGQTCREWPTTNCWPATSGEIANAL